MFFPCSVSAKSLVEGDDAVPFSGVDLKGNTVDIGPLLGKQVILLKFGSIYCSTCVQSIANLADLQKRIPEDRLKIVGINLDIYGTFRVKRFYRGYDEIVNYPVIIDKNLDISRIYGVATLPSIVIIDKEGRVVRSMIGYQESELAPIMEFAEKLSQAKEVTELAGILPSADRQMTILYPSNFTKTLQDSLYIIGEVAKPSTKVQLSLNGGSRQELVAQRSIFYFRTPISLGSNYIEVSVEGAAGSRTNQAVVLFRDLKMGQGFETPFPVYHFHVKENEDDCVKCHEMVPPESSEQTFMAITQMCTECHREFSQKIFVHGPITVGGCAPCHDFTSLPERYELFSTGADLCYSCHEEKRAEFARTNIHGPLAAGVCSMCHSPHSTNEKYQLRLPEGQLCTLCHQQIKSLSFLVSQHRPFEEGKCVGCHNPHSSNVSPFFLHQTGDDLCYMCHDEGELEGHRHPIGTVPTYTYPGMQLTEEGQTTCRSCHAPHATDSEKLLPDAGCPGCHTY